MATRTATKRPSIKGISLLLNRRLWEVDAGSITFRRRAPESDRAKWPPRSGRPRPGAHATPRPSDQPRWILGAKYFIDYLRTHRSALARSAQAELSPLGDGTEIDWFLWDGERPAVQSYASISGYIAAVYRNELYDLTAHNSTYRSFGVAESSVRQRLWLIIRPPLLDEDGRHGVYPRTDRNALLLRGGPNAGGPLPINDWASRFADKMPDELLDAIKKARAGRTGTVSDEVWRQRLADRFGSRWRISKLEPANPGP